jgi:phage tail sheath protein FI
MPVAVSYPGVYVEEIPSGVRTVTGVATSIAAFVDFFPQGPLGPSNAVEVFSFADFERAFGGLDTRSEASYAIQQFFLNGGSQAQVVRVASSTAGKSSAAASIALENSKGSTVLVATAINGGLWGNTLRVDIDYGTTDPTTSFNLTVTQYAAANGTQVVGSEKYTNLVIDPTNANDAQAVINNASALIQVVETAGTPNRPMQSGTSSDPLPATFPTMSAGDKITIASGNGNTAAALLGTVVIPATVPTDYPGLAGLLQSQIRKFSSNAFPNATVAVVGGSTTQRTMVIKAGSADPSTFITLTDAAPATIQKQLNFSPNVQQYALGGAEEYAAANSVPGADGAWNDSSDYDGMASALIGDPAAKTGMYALVDVNIFNILCIPATMNLPDTDAFQVATDATALCVQRRAMYILDTPQQTKTRDDPTTIMAWLDANAGLRSSNAALYFPRFKIADPLNGYRLRDVAPSGTMAGLYARTDASRGVWKAPAGTDATLGGVQQIDYTLTDGENGVLNPLAINCLRNFQIYGPICWGARTLNGADQMADDYKYIPVKRLALFIEESLFRATQWVVFEPNASPLWAQVRLNVGSFMQNLFRQGAFFGTTPSDAYFVTCDATNNPPDTIDLGIINIAVGFAPLKPAEFVIIQIQQIAGQAAS